MKILAIDPGYDRVGIAVIEKKNLQSKETLLYSACFTTDKKESFYTRIYQVTQEIERVIKEFSPESLAMESLFFTKNQKTALHVAEARGAILNEALRAGLTIHEYRPIEVKIAVTGYGKSDKDQVTSMVGKLIKIPTKVTHDDEYDAIAVGLTCAAIEGKNMGK